MSIGICRVQKISGTSGGVGAYIHNERIKDHSNSNPDIDFSRSAENYHVGKYREFDAAQAHTYNQRIEKRLAEGYKGKKAVRKDAVKLVEVLFTSDKTFFDAQADNGRAYFKDCLKWASERFGEDNIIADVVHLDEATPHMHLEFVPLTADGRLSAKEILGDKKQMQQLQDDFYDKVGKMYGLDRGNRADLEAGEGGRKHLTPQELKFQTEVEVNALRQQKKVLQGQIEGLQRDIMTAKQVKDVPHTKALIGDKQLVASDDFDALCKTAALAEGLLEEIKSARKINVQAKAIIKAAEKKSAEIIKNAQEQANSRAAIEERMKYRRKLDHIEEVLASNPQLVKDFKQAESVLQERQQQRKRRDFDR